MITIPMGRDSAELAETAGGVFVRVRRRRGRTRETIWTGVLDLPFHVALDAVHSALREGRKELP